MLVHSPHLKFWEAPMNLVMMGPVVIGKRLEWVGNERYPNGYDTRIEKKEPRCCRLYFVRSSSVRGWVVLTKKFVSSHFFIGSSSYSYKKVQYTSY